MSLCCQVIRLQHNKVSYLLPGGERINAFLRQPPQEPLCSQLWVASLVTSALEPGGRAGLSRAELPGSPFLADLIAQDPSAWLGADHTARFGASLGFLLKLLDSRDRLLIQVHPDDAQARRYFGLPCGKEEAWYVIDADPGACVWLGFRPGVTPRQFRRWIERQDSRALLSCLHQVPIQAGDVLLVPPGTVHAMGPKALVAEIQQPSDITLRAERIRPDGSVLPPESLHGGAGMDALMHCFSFEPLTPAQLAARHFCRPRPLPGVEGLRVLVGPEQSRRLFLAELCLAPGQTVLRRVATFRVLLVLQGRALLQWEGGRMELVQGDELFLPHGVRRYSLHAEGSFRTLECEPPSPGPLP